MPVAMRVVEDVVVIRLARKLPENTALDTDTAYALLTDSGDSSSTHLTTGNEGLRASQGLSSPNKKSSANASSARKKRSTEATDDADTTDGAGVRLKASIIPNSFTTKVRRTSSQQSSQDILSTNTNTKSSSGTISKGQSTIGVSNKKSAVSWATAASSSSQETQHQPTANDANPSKPSIRNSSSSSLSSTAGAAGAKGTALTPQPTDHTVRVMPRLASSGDSDIIASTNSLLVKTNAGTGGTNPNPTGTGTGTGTVLRAPLIGVRSLSQQPRFKPQVGRPTNPSA